MNKAIAAKDHIGRGERVRGEIETHEAPLRRSEALRVGENQLPHNVRARILHA